MTTTRELGRADTAGIAAEHDAISPMKEYMLACIIDGEDVELVDGTSLAPCVAAEMLHGHHLTESQIRWPVTRAEIHMITTRPGTAKYVEARLAGTTITGPRWERFSDEDWSVLETIGQTDRDRVWSVLAAGEELLARRRRSWRSIVTRRRQPRRPNGTGSIGKRYPDGAYMVRATDPLTGRRVKRIVSKAPQQSASDHRSVAEDVLGDLLADVGTPTGRLTKERRIVMAAARWVDSQVDGDWVRFLDMLDQWMEQQERNPPQ